jgi:serine phosphatase RsbU (regulator of sigma subunit)
MAEVVDRRFRWVALGCGLLAVFLGVLTFIGWKAQLPLLASARVGYIPMAPSTALCFTLIGSGLILHLGFPRRLVWVSRAFALVVLALALAKLAEFLGGLNFGIDAWFVSEPGMFGKVPTGRMAPLTAVNFLFVAGGLLELTIPRMAARACLLGALAAVIGAAILVGYLYGTPLLYGGGVIPVALTTACGFVVAGISIMAAAGRRAWPLSAFFGDSTHALLLRAFVPVTIVATLLNGWVRTVVMRKADGNPAVISAMSALGFAALITWIISHVSSRVGGKIDRAEQARNLAQQALVLLNAELELRVADRTREITDRNDQMSSELLMAHELQTALLPRVFPTIPPDVPNEESALQFVSFYFPTGDVSGDFFNVFPIGKQAVGVLICDVMGHGVRSALITSMIRGLVEEHGQAVADPGELLTRINRALTLIFQQANTTMFATAFYVVADVGAGELRFANAGHPSALHIRCGEGMVDKLQGDGRRGPAMGLFSNARYATTCQPMAAGDLIMLFTDGLFEVLSASGTLFTEEKLQETVGRHSALAPEAIFEQVLAEIRRFTERETFDDDVCLVGMKVQHIP